MDREQSDKQPQKGDNITRFRPDRRPAAVGLLRTLGLLIMLAAVVYGVWAYQDDLRIDNFKRLLSYVRAASSGQDSFSTYRFEPGLDTVYAPYDLGLAVVSSDTYRFVTGFGASFSSQLGYMSPALAVSDKQVLIYDRGSRGYTVANSYAILHQGQSGSNILAAAMNAAGDYMLVTEESGYRAGVYVYDSKNREVCVWQTPRYYVALPSLSPDGDRFAVYCLSEAGGVYSGQVRGYDLGDENPAYTLDFGSRQVCSIRHYKNGNLFILCEDGLYVYDTQGAMIARHAFDGLLRFAHHEGGLPMVALRGDAGGGERVRLMAFDQDGAVAWQTQVAGSLRDMDFRGDYGLALLYNQLCILDLSGEAPSFAIQEVPGVRRVLATAAGQGILVYSDRAEGVDLAAQTSQEDNSP